MHLARRVAFILIFICNHAYSQVLSFSSLFSPGEESIIPVKINIRAPVSPRDLTFVRQTINEALQFFNKEMGPLEGTLKVHIGPGGPNLRIGYVPESDTIYFREIEGVQNMGLKSEDVIRHETFHALFCRAFAQFCTPAALAEPPSRVLHEAFADYFAYRLHVDPYFGESYFANKPFIRRYQSTAYLRLTEGEHALGSILVSYLIKHQVSFKQIWDFVRQGDFSIRGLSMIAPEMRKDLERDLSYSVSEQAHNLPHSPLRRYRWPTESSLLLSLTPNSSLLATHPDFKILWSQEDGRSLENYQVEEVKESPFTYRIQMKPGAQSQKVIATFVSQDRILGSRAFYFGPQFEGM